VINRASKILTVGAAVAALLSGCAYRMDRIENPVAMPAAWNATTTPNAKEGVDKEWWKNFNSPVLNDLIEEAFRSNPNIIQTEERLKNAERTLSQAHDGLFPDLSISASSSKGRSGGNNGRLETNTASTSLSLSTSYSVDLWGATAARYRASVANFIGTRYDTDLARIQLAQSIARSYFNLLGTRSQLEVARQNLENAETQLRIVQVRYDNGMVTQYELTQQQTRVLQQRTNMIPQENSLRAAETALGLLLGQTPQDFKIEGEPIGELTVPEVAPWLPGDMLLRRPDIASAETDMAAVQANMVAARASLIPVSLSLSANGSSSSQELLTLTDTRNFSLQGALSIATGIFNYRQRRNTYLTNKSNEYIALITYANTIRTALKDVDDKLANVNAQLLAEQSQQATLDLAQRAMDLANLQYREGTSALQDLLTAQNSLESAKDATARARITRLNAVIDLYVALGGGWEGPSESDLQLMQAKK
jgi:NodT family efflux transporter outer membrane factor (OMF) lipoprotein